jgi:hypothetical protein
MERLAERHGGSYDGWQLTGEHNAELPDPSNPNVYGQP